LQALASPVILIYFLVRGLRNPRYFSTLRERCGTLPPSCQQTVSDSIWFHAVSVGEVLAAIPLLEEVRKRTSGAPIFLSTTTLAGRETAGIRLAGLTDGIFFAPFDFVWAVRRVLRHLRPSVVIVLETEIWPNVFHEAKRLGCGLAIVNGRISDRALPRYRMFASLFASVLSLCDSILAQSDEMRRRFEEAGAPISIVEAGGNLKYDFQPAALASDSPALRFIAADHGRPLWIAASTSADERIAEEESVIEAQRAMPGWRLIVAPRKPERFDAAAQMLARSGLRWTRRSALNDPEADVLLLDSVGELSGLFPHARAVFMGGTLADRGGHNILEPAVFGKPIIAGPHLENFRDVAAHFEQQQAFVRIQTGDELRDAVTSAASDTSLGHRARAAAEQQRGASRRAAGRILDLYESCYPCERCAQPAHLLLKILSIVWRAGSALDRRSKQDRARRLPVPVISIGNITAGGTGKTPVTIDLLREFRGSRPGLLTRGHGRSTSEIVLILDETQRLPISLTGDEPRLCSRLARVPVGIGADRYTVGERLLESADVRLLFLDDGFQHRQLERHFDLVLIDALRPFGGGNLIPLGRLREPLDGLARASAFLITRANTVPNGKTIETILRRYNPTAPVFHARTVASYWTDFDGATLSPGEFRSARAIAFCGLGNPESFWRSLDELGVVPLERYAWGDHHRYTPAELRRLVRRARDIGADVLLTTAKDALNLDRDYRSIAGSLRLFWLEISVEIDRREELIRAISDSAGLNFGKI
jgi:3-deoxy-D-manno-octulosonic-acid transferase